MLRLPFRLDLRLKLIILCITLALVPLSLVMGFILEKVQLETTTLLIWALIVLIIAFLTALMLIRHIVRPIELILNAYQKFGQGYLDYRVSINTHDEIENLANGFNQMAAKLKESIQILQQDRALMSAERNKLAVILAGVVDAVIAVDLGRRIVLFNKGAQNLTGFNEADVLGKPIDQVIKLYDQNQEITPLNYCPIRADGFEGLVFNKQDLKLVGKDMQVSINLTSGQIAGGESANLGCILTFHDVTREKQLDVMKLDFVSMAAHELRTPLTSIKGYLSVFIEENKANFNKEQMSFLSRVTIATQQLAGLIENLLSVSKIERGTLGITMEEIDWPTNVKEVVEQFIDRAKEKKLELKFIPSSTPKLKADKLRINEVISNLLSNAVSYTLPGGKITVWVEATNEEVVTHISDTGAGIPKEAIPHLFTKFFRVSGALGKGSKGTGLGLYISKSVIDLHHGKIWVESEVGKGSTFSFSIPI